MSIDSGQQFWLLLDVRKNEAQFMFECKNCGAITRRTIEEVWRAGIITCECGLEAPVEPQDLKALQAQAMEMELKIARLLTAN